MNPQLIFTTSKVLTAVYRIASTTFMLYALLSSAQAQTKMSGSLHHRTRSASDPFDD